MNDGEASRVFVGDDAEILNNPSWVDVQIKQIKLKDNYLSVTALIYHNDVTKYRLKQHNLNGDISIIRDFIGIGQLLYIVVELLKKTVINEKSRVRISNKNLIKFDF